MRSLLWLLLLLRRSLGRWRTNARIAIWRRLLRRRRSTSHVVPLLLLLLLLLRGRWPRRRSSSRHVAHCRWLPAHARRSSVVAVRVVVAHHHVGVVVAAVRALHRMSGVRIRIILGRHSLWALLSHMLWRRRASVHSRRLLVVRRAGGNASVRGHVVAAGSTVPGHHRGMRVGHRWSIDSASGGAGRLVLVPHRRRWSLRMMGVVHRRLGVMLLRVGLWWWRPVRRFGWVALGRLLVLRRLVASVLHGTGIRGWRLWWSRDSLQPLLLVGRCLVVVVWWRTDWGILLCGLLSLRLLLLLLRHRRSPHGTGGSSRTSKHTQGRLTRAGRSVLNAFPRTWCGGSLPSVWPQDRDTWICSQPEEEEEKEGGVFASCLPTLIVCLSTRGGLVVSFTESSHRLSRFDHFIKQLGPGQESTEGEKWRG